MITTIQQGSTEQTIKKTLAKFFSKKKTKGLDAKRYCGVLDLDRDVLTTQKKLCDEWK